MAWKASTRSSIAGNIIEGGAIDTQVTGTGNLGEQEAGLTVGTSVDFSSWLFDQCILF